MTGDIYTADSKVPDCMTWHVANGGIIFDDSRFENLNPGALRTPTRTATRKWTLQK